MALYLVALAQGGDGKTSTLKAILCRTRLPSSVLITVKSQTHLACWCNRQTEVFIIVIHQLSSFDFQIIDHLKTELSAWKQDVKSQRMSRLQSSFECQVNSLKENLTDKKKVLEEEIAGLEQRIGDHRAWITQGNKHQ